MSLNKHSRDYDGGTPDIPEATGDVYRVHDLFRDLEYLQKQVGTNVRDAFGVSGATLIRGGEVSQGTGDTLDITPVVAYIPYQVKVPDSYASNPPTVKNEDTIRRVESTQQTDLAIGSATLDGSTLNYVKLRASESNGSSRSRLKTSGTYVYEKVDSFEIVVNTTAPTAYDLLLATFTGSTGGTFRFFDQRYRYTSKGISRNLSGAGQIVTGFSAKVYTAPNGGSICGFVAEAWCSENFYWAVDQNNERLAVYEWEVKEDSIAEIATLDITGLDDTKNGLARITDNICVLMNVDDNEFQAYEFDPTVPSISTYGASVGVTAFVDVRMSSCHNGKDFLWTDKSSGEGKLAIWRLEGTSLIELASATDIGDTGCNVVAVDPIHFVTFDYDADDTVQMWEFDGESITRLGSSFEPFSGLGSAFGPFLATLSNTDVIVASSAFAGDGLSSRQIRFNFETSEWSIVKSNLPIQFHGFIFNPIGGLGGWYVAAYENDIIFNDIILGTPYDMADVL